MEIIWWARRNWIYFALAAGVLAVALVIYLVVREDEPANDGFNQSIRTVDPRQEYTPDTEAPPPTSVTIGDVPVSILPDAQGDDSGRKVAACIDYYKAINEVDTTRPYPGLDVAKLRSTVTGRAAAAVERMISAWSEPSEAQLRDYRISQQAKIRSSLKITKGYLNSHLNAPNVVTLEGTLTKTSATATPNASKATIQCRVAEADGQWKVSRATLDPQAP